MKKLIYALCIPLVVVSGLVYANRAINPEVAAKPNPTPLSAAEKDAEKKKWEATPAGMHYKAWAASPEGIKVLAGAAKIRKHTSDSSKMEAVVTSLSLPPGSRLGFGVMARIDGVDYILKFDAEASQLESLQTLQVNDQLIIKSHAVSHAPKYAYPIITGSYVERAGKIIFKRIPRKGGC